MGRGGCLPFSVIKSSAGRTARADLARRDVCYFGTDMMCRSHLVKG
jgi:hypothetical protein